ncbi:MAG: DUF4340 domain-containing protein [Anaerolineae bacterium]|nr:DUF4340 domain-containing protein [Anaerolineae bacterium]
MNRTNLFLTVILIVQAILIAIIALPRNSDAESGNSPLLAGFDATAVDNITITDSDDKQIRLVKADDVWVLADVDNYPAQETRVSDLLNTLSALNASRLVSDNSANQRRLGVADDEFERKIEITQGSQTYTVYIGTSGGANATHTRLGGQDQVYLNRDISPASVSAELTSWSQTSYIQVEREKVVSMTITNANGTFEFENVDGVWQMVGLADGETFNEQNFTELLDKIVAFNLRKPLGTEALPDYGFDEPLATVTFVVRDTLVTSEDENSTGQTLDTTYELVIGGRYEDGFAVKFNRSEFYVLASAFYATDFTEERREDFIVAVGS